MQLYNWCVLLLSSTSLIGYQHMVINDETTKIKIFIIFVFQQKLYRISFCYCNKIWYYNLTFCCGNKNHENHNFCSRDNFWFYNICTWNKNYDFLYFCSVKNDYDKQQFWFLQTNPKLYSLCAQNKNYENLNFCSPLKTKIIIFMIFVGQQKLSFSWFLLQEQKFVWCLFGGCCLLVIFVYSLQTMKNSHNNDYLSNLDRCELHKKIPC